MPSLSRCRSDGPENSINTGLQRFRSDGARDKCNNLRKFLHSGNLINSNHANNALGLIAKNKPEQQASIIKELLAVSKDVFNTDEYKAIALGKIIETLSGFLHEIQSDEAALDFIGQAQSSERDATKQKALQ